MNNRPRELSDDEQDVVLANQVVVDQALTTDRAGVDGIRLARRVLPTVLSAYRDARIAGLCHEGACELAREASRVEIGRYTP